MIVKKSKYILPWVVYILALTIYVVTLSTDITFFGISHQNTTPICLVMIAVTIFLSLSNITDSKKALLYIVYWLAFAVFVEFATISDNRFTHDEAELTTTLFGVVPAFIAFNWLIIFFSIYSLTTFASFFLIRSSKHISNLLLLLFLDGLFIVLYGLMIDPMGHHAGYFTWNNESAKILIWETIPLRTYIEYFLGVPVIMLPIRWFEVFKVPPKKEAFIRKVSFPLYFGWSLFAALTYWSFRTGIDKVGNFGLVMITLITIYIVIGRRIIRSRS